MTEEPGLQDTSTLVRRSNRPHVRLRLRLVRFAHRPVARATRSGCGAARTSAKNSLLEPVGVARIWRSSYPSVGGQSPTDFRGLRGPPNPSASDSLARRHTDAPRSGPSAHSAASRRCRVLDLLRPVSVEQLGLIEATIGSWFSVCRAGAGRGQRSSSTRRRCRFARSAGR